MTFKSVIEYKFHKDKAEICVFDVCILCPELKILDIEGIQIFDKFMSRGTIIKEYVFFSDLIYHIHYYCLSLTGRSRNGGNKRNISIEKLLYISSTTTRTVSLVLKYLSFRLAFKEKQWTGNQHRNNKSDQKHAKLSTVHIIKQEKIFTFTSHYCFNHYWFGELWSVSWTEQNRIDGRERNRTEQNRNYQYVSLNRSKFCFINFWFWFLHMCACESKYFSV